MIRGVIIVFGVVLLSGCALVGGSGGLVRAQGYQISAPKTWKPMDREESDYAYRTSGGNVATVTSSCQRPSRASLQVLTRQLLIGTRSTVLKRQEERVIGGIPGLRTEVDTTLDGEPFHLELFVFKKRNCVFDFSLLSRAPITQDQRQEFESFIASFRNG